MSEKAGCNIPLFTFYYIFFIEKFFGSCRNLFFKKGFYKNHLASKVKSFLKMKSRSRLRVSAIGWRAESKA